MILDEDMWVAAMVAANLNDYPPLTAYTAGERVRARYLGAVLTTRTLYALIVVELHDMNAQHGITKAGEA